MAVSETRCRPLPGQVSRDGGGGVQDSHAVGKGAPGQAAVQRTDPELPAAGACGSGATTLSRPPANGRLGDTWAAAGQLARHWTQTVARRGPSWRTRCPCPCRRCTRGVPAAYRGRTHGAANHSPYGAGQAERVVLPESVCLAGRYQMKTGEGEPNGASAAQDLPHPDAFNAARCLPAHPDRGTAAGGPAGLSPRQPKAACRPDESSNFD